MKSVKKKTLLYRSKVESAPFCINHVLGCSHGCTYPCYALLMAKRFGRIEDYADWLQPRLVEGALHILDKEIPKFKNKINFVHLCFTTDPFMYGYQEVEELSLKIIERLNKNEIRTSTLTKGICPMMLTNQEVYGYNNTYGISLVSLSENFRRRFEPFTAPFYDRINALKHLHDAGLQTWVNIEPYPTPNLFEQNILDVLNAVSFVDEINFGRLNHNSKANTFDGNTEFYESCTDSVTTFCKENSIECHIKKDTQLNVNKTTKQSRLTKVSKDVSFRKKAATSIIF